MKPGCAPGSDGISPEHIKHACDSKIIVHLCQLFTVCFQHGVIPSAFTKGILVPLLKQPSLNPSLPKNYRPIILSNMYSKIIELFVSDQCTNVNFSKLQFGFVNGRNTSTAISLANDICSYFGSHGSQVFMCGLDAEGAFDAIPHPIIFSKCMNIIPDMCWRLLLNWYSSLSVQIKWGPLISNTISVRKGTRQGGLTSPFMFNLFYKDLVNLLNKQDGGLTIGSQKFNVVCYADDLLL